MGAGNFLPNSDILGISQLKVGDGMRDESVCSARRRFEELLSRAMRSFETRAAKRMQLGRYGQGDKLHIAMVVSPSFTTTAGWQSCCTRSAMARTNL